jgi:hypothetical protein
MSDCYDACSTGDCDVCGLYTDTFKGWRGVWMRLKARVLRRFAGRFAPVPPGKAEEWDWSFPPSGTWDLGIRPAGGGERVSFGTFSGSYGAAAAQLQEHVVHLALTKGEAIAGDYDVRRAALAATNPEPETKEIDR